MKIKSNSTYSFFVVQKIYIKRLPEKSLEALNLLNIFQLFNDSSYSAWTYDSTTFTVRFRSVQKPICYCFCRFSTLLMDILPFIFLFSGESVSKTYHGKSLKDHLLRPPDNYCNIDKPCCIEETISFSYYLYGFLLPATALFILFSGSTWTWIVRIYPLFHTYNFSI